MEKNKKTQAKRYTEKNETQASCGCGSSCLTTSENKGKDRLSVYTLLLSAVLLVLSFLPLLDQTGVMIAAAVSALFAGYPMILKAFQKTVKLRFDENTLLVVAIIAAFTIAEFREAAAIALFFRLGETLEDYASSKSKKSISDIAKIRPQTANIKTGDSGIKVIDASKVEVGSTIVVMPHESVPLDGVVLNGQSSVDASALTGESLPVEVGEGSEVLSGMINGNSSITVLTKAKFEDSAASRIIEMVESAVERKGSSQRIITRFARIYTPVIIALGAAIGIVPSLITGDWHTWIYRGLVILVASCPCALVLSVPLGFFAGMGAAARRGILVKGGRFVETMSKARVAVFDKTGTLTTGVLKIGKINSYNGFTTQQVKEYAIAVERFSEHPIAKSIVKEFGEMSKAHAENFEELAGGGVKAEYLSQTVICGGKKLMKNNSVKLSTANEAAIYIAVDGVLVGSIEVETVIREDAKQTVDGLRRLGFKKITMLSGDSEKNVRKTASECGINEYYAQLMPDEKLKKLLEIKEKDGETVFVGDGINDAPVLAAANAGVAMGLGANAAMQAADVVLTGSVLYKLIEAVNLFRRTMSIVRFNILFAVLVKAVVLILGGLGFAPMWAAVFADVGVLIITVANSSRLLRKKHCN